MAGKLSEEQRQEIVRRYEGGESAYKIAAAIGCGHTTVYKILKLQAAAVRSWSEASYRRYGKEPIRISQEALWMAYAGPGSGYPSAAELGRRWGTNEMTVMRLLKKNGIRIRSLSEQKKIETALGRESPPSPPECNFWTAESRPVTQSHISKTDPDRWRDQCRRHSERMSRTTQHPCYWCGSAIRRAPCNFKNLPFVHCSRRCFGQYHSWRSKSDESARPLIVQRLRDLLREHPYKALPFTRETVEKAGAAIGAQEAEVFEVLYEGRP